MSAHGDRQYTPDGRGTPPQAVLPIREENTPFLEATLGEGLDSFDSEASLGMLARRAGTERTSDSDLDMFPSERVAADAVAAGAVPETVVAPRAVVAADWHLVVVSTAPGAVAGPTERLRVVPATQRAQVSLTRRLSLVAGILACLGVPTVGILLWRSPAWGVAPAAVVRDGAMPSAASVAPQEPIPTLRPMPTPGAPTTLEPATTSEPIMPPEPATDGRGPIATPDAVADAPPPRRESTTRTEGLAQDVSADTTETAAAPLAAENTATPISAAPAELHVSSPIPEQPLSVTLPPSVDTPAAPLPPAPPMPTAAPVSAPAVAGAGSATAVTLAPAPARDAADIQTVLTRYRSAFSDLDATAVSKVWPNADARALARAFRGLAEQGIVFENCDIWVAGTSAAATCGGTVRYVTKVGSRDARTEHRRWQFTLGKMRDLWMIQTVESQ